jgi:hypothetical protein
MKPVIVTNIHFTYGKEILTILEAQFQWKGKII